MKNKITRLLIRPFFAVLLGVKGEESQREVTRLLTVEGTSPVERDKVADYTCHIIGMFIPVTVIVAIVFACITGDGGLASRLAVAPITFFFASFIWFARRTVYADSEKSRWQDLDKAGTPELYKPDDWSEKSIPRDSDFILPLIATIVLTPLISTWEVLAF